MVPSVMSSQAITNIRNSANQPSAAYLNTLEELTLSDSASARENLARLRLGEILAASGNMGPVVRCTEISDLRFPSGTAVNCSVLTFENNRQLKVKQDLNNGLFRVQVIRNGVVCTELELSAMAVRNSFAGSGTKIPTELLMSIRNELADRSLLEIANVYKKAARNLELTEKSPADPRRLEFHLRRKLSGRILSENLESVIDQIAESEPHALASALMTIRKESSSTEKSILASFKAISAVLLGYFRSYSSLLKEAQVITPVAGTAASNESRARICAELTLKYGSSFRRDFELKAAKRE